MRSRHVGDFATAPDPRRSVSAKSAFICGWIVPRNCLIAMLVAAGLPLMARAADKADFAGTWQGQSGDGGFQETWTIAKSPKGWSVAGVFKQDDKEVGKFEGKNCRLAKGVLTFQQKYSRKPVANWSDGNTIQAKVDGDTLNFTWTKGKQKGTGSLTRVEDDAPEDSAEDAAKPKRAEAKPDRSAGPKPKGVSKSIDGPKIDSDAATKSRAKPKPKTLPAAKPDDTAKPDDGSVNKAPPSAAERESFARLAGAWTFSDFVYNGATVEFGATWTIKNGRVVEDIGGLARREGPVKLEPEADPPAIDIDFNKGPGGAEMGLFKGIYELDGDQLTICLNSQQRPSDFKSRAGGNDLLIVFKRKK